MRCSLFSEELFENVIFDTDGKINEQAKQEDCEYPNNQPTNESGDSNIQPARRGRKATIKNPNHEEFVEIFTELWDDVKEVIESDQIGVSNRNRPDVKDKKIISKIWKFSKTLLNWFCTDNQRKGKSKKKMFELYKRWFEDGFLPFMAENLDNSEENKVLLFRDFIKLSFPPKKAQGALSILNEDWGYQF